MNIFLKNVLVVTNGAHENPKTVEQCANQQQLAHENHGHKKE